MNESFQPVVILEVVLYDWSRGSGYSGSYAAPGTSNSGSAERRAETEEGGAAGTGSGGGEANENEGVLPIVALNACPCPPAILFGDGDVYEEEDDEEGQDGAGLTLVRKDGKMIRGRGNSMGSGGGGAGEGGVLDDLLTAGELACDVGGLDSQLEDIVRRVLSTRSLPPEVRQ